MVTIVVPVYNEKENIEKLFSRIKSAFIAEKIDYEIIIIDDNSTDGTWKVLEKNKTKYPLQIFKKEGKKGKAYSLVEGFNYAKGEILAMIDADLQYPPEAIPQMAKAIGHDCDIVVANRKYYQASKFRKLASGIFRFTFGELLFGIGCDIQSGLKVFKKDVWKTVEFQPRSAWAFDLEFLKRAKDSCFVPKIIDITFEKRQNGTSKISFAKNTWDLATNALILRTKSSKPIHLKSHNNDSMKGAGIVHKGKKFITHTTLSHNISALQNFSFWQKTVLLAIIAGVFLGLIFDWLTTVAVTIALLSTIYFIDVIFNLFLVLKSLNSPPDYKIANEEIDSLDNHKLPVYSILCPLYKEAHVLPRFLESIKNIDWPKEKLDVLLLLEEDDKATRIAVSKLELPSYVTVVVVPHSMPKTKPKACNYGLSYAKGEYVVIYDAEDRPDPYQLKKAFITFEQSDKKVICLQAKLNYYNPKQNLLTRLFTAEYSLWFDLTLTGLQSINTYIPLGGTSNHFRTKDLIKLEGWDPFNVTEDADLGERLFKAGYKTAIIDSTTYEEANSKLGNWLRQRSRWIKGYMQTYLVHMRNPVGLVRENGIHAFLFQLVVGGKIAFLFINPILWVLTISYFALNRLVGPTIEALYPSYILYMAAGSLVFGNFLFMYYYMVGCAKREQWSLMKYVFLVPFYWLAVSVAGVKALHQLILKPHYWEKTVHGLDQLQIKQIEEKTTNIFDKPRFAYFNAIQTNKMKNFASSGKAAGGILIVASIIGNFFNFLYNAYLGRTVSLEQFGLVSLIGSFLFIVTIPFNSLSRTVTHKSAYFLGEYGTSIRIFWLNIRKRSILIGLAATLIWLGVSPFLVPIFKSQSIIPFILFAPVWFIGLVAAVDTGYLNGNLKFIVYSVLMVTAAIFKFIFSWMFVQIGYPNYVYAAIPLSMTASFLIGWLYASRVKEKYDPERKPQLKFPLHFFITSAFSEFSILAFLSFDVILAKVFLSPKDAGEYAILALFGKMIFFVGGLFGQFITPIISREEGAKRDSKTTFYKLFFASAFSSTIVYFIITILGFETAEFLMGSKVQPVEYLLPIYGFGILAFTVSARIVNYYQVKHKHIYPTTSFILAICQIIGISIFHGSLEQIVNVMLAVGVANLIIVLLLHFFEEELFTIGRNFQDVVDLFLPNPWQQGTYAPEKRILIFNWRDTKHVWAGGAELYIHEIAKGWIQQGNHVTIFCGNDRKNLKYEWVDGIEIIRRGGFYTIYLLAPLYYFFKLRKRFDIVIDSENGIPFFTPLYVAKPIIGLIHHVHQDVFRTKLKFPLAQIGKFLEGKAMPFVYRDVKLITVSRSSKDDMEKIGLGKRYPIEIIQPGVDIQKFKPGPKTVHPSLIYLGRLQPYKSIDTLIKALVQVKKEIPNVKLTIAGEGESKKHLEILAHKLGINDAINFVGRITEQTKTKLLSESWVMVQPSKVEGWGITVIEANASGTPVVASNVPGLRDSVKNPHTGFLVPWGDHEKFAEKIELLIKNNRLRKSFEKYSVYWAKQFTWESAVKKSLEIIYGEKINNNKFKKPKTVTVGISAFNEEQNIKNLLNSIYKQNRGQYKLNQVYVLSDGSTDNTEGIVEALSKRKKNLTLIADGSRLGKTARVNQLFRLNKSDILLYLDGDVVLENQNTIDNVILWFNQNKISLVGLNKLPVNARNLTEQLINTWFLIWYEIRKNFDGGHNIYNFSSCAFALDGKFAKKLKCPEGDFSLNKYLFFKAYVNKKSYRFAKDSAVLYRSPDNINDRLKQFKRFTNVNERIAEYFGDWTYDLYKVPVSQEIKGTLRAFIKNPFWMPIALVFHVVIRKMPYRDEPLIKKGLWEPVPSSKKVI